MKDIHLPEELNDKERAAISDMITTYRTDNPERYQRLMELYFDESTSNGIDFQTIEIKERVQNAESWLVGKIRECMADRTTHTAAIYFVINRNNIIASKLRMEDNATNIIISPFVYTMK